MNANHRVVVTGMGIVTPIGFDLPSVWGNLLAGQSGIHRIRSEALVESRVVAGAEVDSQQLAHALATRSLVPFDRTVDMGLLAADQALEAAGLKRVDSVREEPKPLATLWGTGAGSSVSLGEVYQAFHTRGPRGIRPTSVPRCMANALASKISLHFRLTGPNYVVVSACAASTVAMGIAFRMIRHGYAEAVLCGGSDAVFDPCFFASWCNLGVLSPCKDPRRACRPFDRDRDGTVLGEGAAALVFERLDRALARGAMPLAEICGYGESSDAIHLTRPDAEGQARAIRSALASAGMKPDEIGLINAHGTATPANDVCESQAIRLALGNAADRIPVSANKSYFGHTLGASGALETIVSILSLRERVAPPNLNLDHPDPDCGLRLVASAPERLEKPAAIKNSFGFGGNNAVLVVRAWEGTETDG